MWKFLTITISLSDGQIYDYKQLPSNTKIGYPTKTDRYCEVCQGYLPFSSLVWWYVILIVIIEILKFLKLYIPLSESPHFPDDFASTTFSIKFVPTFHVPSKDTYFIARTPCHLFFYPTHFSVKENE